MPHLLEKQIHQIFKTASQLNAYYSLSSNIDIEATRHSLKKLLHLTEDAIGETEKTAQ